MGKPKQTLPLLGEPMLERVLGVLRRSNVDLTVVVLGAGADEIRKKVKLKKERLVINRAYRKGMSESLKLGIKSVEREADAVLVVLADQPLLAASTVDQLVDAYVRSKRPVVVPLYNGVAGNPVLFDRSLFPRIMRIEGDKGAKSVVEENRGRLVAVDVGDEGVIIDVDTPSDYERATSKITRLRRTQGSA
jgi:molybdenum cofactor cytidylyltransferase